MNERAMIGQARFPTIYSRLEEAPTTIRPTSRATGWWRRGGATHGQLALRGGPSCSGRIARVGLVLHTLGLFSCAGSSSRALREADVRASATADTAEEVAPTLIGAHALHDAPAPAFPAAGRDELQLVVSVPLDPTSISAEAFLVLGADGRRVTPARTTLAPADERDEGRALTLRGDFGDGSPTDVRVVGPVRVDDGRSLRGAVVSVLPLWAPVRLLLAYPVSSAAGRCEGFAAVIRTWWSQPIDAPLSDGQVVRFVVRRADGRELAPVTVEDHTHAPPPRLGDAASPDAPPMPLGSVEVGGGEVVNAPAARDDAVLDLCFAEPVSEGTLVIPAGVVIGRTGRAAEAQQVAVVDAAAVPEG